MFAPCCAECENRTHAICLGSTRSATKLIPRCSILALFLDKNIHSFAGLGCAVAVTEFFFFAEWRLEAGDLVLEVGFALNELVSRSFLGIGIGGYIGIGLIDVPGGAGGEKSDDDQDATKDIARPTSQVGKSASCSIAASHIRYYTSMLLYTPQNKKRVRLIFMIVGIILIISFLALYMPSLQQPVQPQQPLNPNALGF